MERMRLAALCLGVVAVAALVLGAFLLGSMITPPTCPLTFSVKTVNTTFGWIYLVEYLRGTPQPLSAYNATFFTWTTNATGSEQRAIEYEGPLTALVGAAGNVSFEDRGGLAGFLDDSGDYFWAQTWYNLLVHRGDLIVGGTIACI